MNGDDRWNAFRTQMPVAARFAYFDHAAVAPLSEPARRAIHTWANEVTEFGDTLWPQWERAAGEVRTMLAEWIHADPAEVSLVPNTTAGLTLVAEGFPWASGDNAVIAANEFPSNIYPWLNLRSRGVEVRLAAPDGIRLTIDRLAKLCDERTRILSVSWVGFATGWRIDLEELVRFSHSRGILVCLDAIQGLGVFPLDVQRIPIDFLSADGHKWMLGPEGAGLLYVRRDHLALLRPIGVGWNSVEHSYDFSKVAFALKPDASRYEGGTRNMGGFLGLRASMRLLGELGLGPQSSAIADRVLWLAEQLGQRITDVGGKVISDRTPQHASGIVAFEMPGRDPLALRRECLERDVVLSCRGGWLRASPHAYNNEDDIERLIACLRK